MASLTSFSLNAAIVVSVQLRSRVDHNLVLVRRPYLLAVKKKVGARVQSLKIASGHQLGGALEGNKT